MALLKQSIPVIGIDPNLERLRLLCSGVMQLHRRIPELSMDFREYIESGTLILTTGTLPSDDAPSVHFVCVPTEVGGRPDESVLRDVVGIISQRRAPQYVIVESTISPSWLDRGYFVGVKLCMAPRRDWFHSAEHNVQTLTRVVAASDRDTERVVGAWIRRISKNVVISESMKAVALTKAYENSLWYLMFAYTNCLAQERRDVDMTEVLRLARTNWRTPFEIHPALNVGGYCLPLSLQYVSEGTGEKIEAFAKAVSQLNTQGVAMTAELIAAEAPRSVLILGLCYRPDVKVHVNSAGLELARALSGYGIRCSIHDPL
jgi:nucleotide sugar dehydrogenase